MNKLLSLRFWLEIIALPAFVFLVVHLSGHGMMMLLHGEHDHGHHGEVHEEHEGEEPHGEEVKHKEEVHHDEDEEAHEEEHHEDEEMHEEHEEEHHGHGGSFVDILTSQEVLGGILLFLLFTWLWHRPALKRWVPCMHDHCHEEMPIPHTLAIVAFCLHFFPEAAVRHELIESAANGEITSILGAIAFGSHFFVDVIVAIVISSYWKTRYGFIISLGIITAMWLLAFYKAESMIDSFPASAEGILFLISAFLLAMFIHKPHKPVKCSTCDSQSKN